MAIDKGRINARADLGITAGVFIIAVAAAIVSYVAINGFGFIGAIGVLLLVFGAYMLARAMNSSDKEEGFGPSAQSYRLVWGVLLLVIGLCAVVYAAVPGISVWIYVAAVLIAIAILAIGLGLKKKGEVN